MRIKHKLEKIIFVLGMIFVLSTVNNKSIIDNQQNKENLSELINCEVHIAGEGENLNVTLHQSYLNTSAYKFENLNHFNKIYAPCPTEPTFNSSFMEVIIEDIIALNKTLNIELDTSESVHLGASSNYTYAFSFEVEKSCYLENFSICLSENHPETDDGQIWFYLYSAEESGGTIIPDAYLSQLGSHYIIENDIDEVWFNFTGFHEYLNTSETYNNTFFINIYQGSSPLYTRVEFHYMRDNAGDQLDNSLVYESSGTMWYLENWDASLVITLSPINNIPSPSQANLRINGSTVLDKIPNSGYWNSTNEYTNYKGLLTFELSTNWWDISCKITEVQINFTKTDQKAKTTYTTPENNLVLWNASFEETIICFDSRIDNYNTMSFMIPSNWSEIRAFNDDIEKPVLVSAPLVNGYKEVIVLDAGNGANWFITAMVDNRTSTNGGDTNGGDTIPLGNFYLLFTVIIVIFLVYFKIKKHKSKYQ